MDYLDVVVHIFTPEAREFYRLEQLWGEAPARAGRVGGFQSPSAGTRTCVRAMSSGPEGRE